MGAEAEKKNEYSSDRLRKRKNPHHEDAILEGGRRESPLCETLQSETIKNVQQHGQSKGGKW
ncbi:hypothetical protein D8674_001174 [Pyrus ussuriensis x Pyrus communis]|uniref:Uncharacterized protein n=1 Tax=Pyrus ussuriensis x Pyrus communis TaxID=2448454 RepID=A0A5N5FIQ3_9ROSA|nr:hypothetical protein D8674_001174 [Pyrus ussuriensis x Pyrus communis]